MIVINFPKRNRGTGRYGEPLSARSFPTIGEDKQWILPQELGPEVFHGGFSYFPIAKRKFIPAPLAIL